MLRAKNKRWAIEFRNPQSRDWRTWLWYKTELIRDTAFEKIIKMKFNFEFRKKDVARDKRGRKISENSS